MSQKLNLRPNAEICDILLFQSKNDFDYKLKILLTMKTLEISPNKKMIEKLEEEVKEARKIIVQMVCSIAQATVSVLSLTVILMNYILHVIIIR